MQNKSFLGGLALGLVIGFGLGALVTLKACPPTPLPAEEPAPGKAPPIGQPAPAVDEETKK